MKDHCIENLNEIKALLQNLPMQVYQRPSNILSGATIGQHVRHILEFYVGLLSGASAGSVNYDDRERNYETESNPIAAISLIDGIIEKLSALSRDHNLKLDGNFGKTTAAGQAQLIATSIYRELAYNLEHSIHHQALIKVGLKESGYEHLIDDDFWVAPATLRYIKENEAVNADR